MAKELTLGVLFEGRISDSLTSAVKKIEAAVKGMNTVIGDSTKTMNASSNAMKESEQRATAAAKAHDKVNSSAKSTGASLNFMGKQIGTLNGFYDRLIGAFKVTTSYGIAATAIYSVVNAFNSGIAAIVDYDQGLKNLQAITGATDMEVTAMGETIKQVARDTKFSTTEVSDGMTLLGQAGLTASESITAMRDTALLATGTLADMQLSTDLVSTTIRAFGLSAADSGRIVDVMANAVNKSKLTIEKLRTAFNYVAASASAAGLSLEETAGTMMNLADSGLRASTIGTGLRQVLARVVNPSERMGQALASVSLTLNDINPKTVGWSGTLQSLTKILYDSDTKTVNMAKAFQLFGLRGAQAAAVIVQGFVGGKYAEAMENVYSIGSAEAMAAKQAEGLAVTFKNLVDRAKNVAVAIGEAGAAGAIKTFLDVIRNALAAVEAFAGTVAGQVIIQLTALTAAYKLTTAAAGQFMKVLGQTAAVRTVVTTYQTLTTTLGKSGLVGALTTAAYAFEFLLKKIHPIIIVTGLVVAAIAGYRAAIQKQVKDAELFVSKNTQIVDSLKSYQFALQETGDKVLKANDGTNAAAVANNAYIATLQRLIKEHPELKDKIKLTTDAIEENNRVLKEFTGGAHLVQMKALMALYDEYADAVERSSLWAGAWEAVKNALAGVVDGTKWLWEETGKAEDAIWDANTAYHQFVQDQAKKIPLVGGAISTLIGKVREFGSASKTILQDTIDWWAKYFTDLGKGSAGVKETTDKMVVAIDEMAKAYYGVGVSAGLSIDDVRKELATLSDDGGRIDKVIAKVEEMRVKWANSSEFVTNLVEKATNEMNASWQKHYNDQDIMGKYYVKQTWEKLQTQAKDLAEHLAKRVQMQEISQADMNAAMQQWWDKELQGYITKQTKEEDAQKKSLEKQLAEYEKFTDKIKSIEEKLAEDKKKIRQADMTDEQIARDNLLAAQQATAEAQKAVAEAVTEKDREEALKKVEIAREMWGKILDESYKAEEETTQSAQETTTKIKETHKERVQSTKDYTAEELEVIRKARELGADGFDIQQARELQDEQEHVTKLEEMRNKMAQDDIARIKQQYGENSKEVQNYVQILINRHGEAKAKQILGDQEITASNKKAYNSMKTEAENAFGLIENLLKDIVAKFETPATVKIENKPAEDALTSVTAKSDGLTASVAAPKTVTIDKAQAETSFNELMADEKSLKDAIEFQKNLNIVNEVALRSLDETSAAHAKLKEDIETGKNLLIVYNKALEGLSAVDTKAEETKAKVETPMQAEVTVEKPKADLEAVKTTDTEVTNQVEAPKKVTVETGTARIDLLTIKNEDGEVTKQIEKPKNYIIDDAGVMVFFDRTTGELTRLKEMIDGDKTYYIEVSKAEADLLRLETRTTALSTAITTDKEFMATTGAAEADITYLQELSDSVASSIKEEKEYGTDTSVAEGKLENLQKIIGGLSAQVAEERKLNIDFTGSGSSTLPLSDKINAVTALLDSIKTGVWDTTVNIAVTGMDLLNQAHDLLTKVGGLVTTSTHNIIVNGLAELQAAISYQRRQDGLVTTSTHVIKVEGEGSTRKPIGEKIREVAGWLDGLKEKAENSGAKIVYAFTGTGSDELPISEKIDEIEEDAAGLSEAVSAGSVAMQHAVTDAENAIASVSQVTASSMESQFTSAIHRIIDKIDALISKIGEVSKSGAIRIVRDINIIGDTLTAYDEKTEAQLWHKSFYKQGGAVPPTMDTGGKLGGYGGGDTVPAMLEKGEFVIRKEAVKKYGAGLFEKLNSMVAKMKIGGYIPKITMPSIEKFAGGGGVGGSGGGFGAQLSNQLHTINLKINNSQHTLYGDEQAVKGLVKTLRREQLVMA